MSPWKLPLVVAALIVPIVLGFALGGGGVGVGVGAMTVIAVVLVAARQRPRGTISSAPAGDDGAARRVLLVVTTPVEEPHAVAEIRRAAGLTEGGEDTDVLVLAPTRIGFLDRWASDVEPARRDAQRSLVATVAALAKAGIAAEARVGDEDVVQAVEDQLQTYPATDVVLVSGAGEVGLDRSAVSELDSRLEPEFRHVALAAE